MEKWYGIGFIIICIIFFLLWRKERRKRIENEKQQKEVDILLTQSIAENLDLEKEIQKLQKKYKKQKDSENEIKELHEKSRMLKHDMKNHSIVLLNYLEAGKIEEAKQYTSRLADDLNNMYSYVYVGNALLSYIINQKCSKAKEEGIDIRAEIENLPFSYMDSFDFSVLLNNLLDNAIEASGKTEEKKMKVSILRKKGFDTICIENSIKGSVLTNNPKLETIKSEEGHGFGMKQIRRIVNKYDGMLDIYEKEGQFVVNVVYPN